MIDYYESLGLEHDASAENIKSAYRQLAKRYHPDVLGGDPVVFSRITEAYEVLSEPARRKSYDQALRARKQRREEALRPQPRPRQRSPDAGLGPPFTRVMSLIMPRNGRFLLEGLTGKFSIQLNTPDNLWETTRRKFAGEDEASLIRKVVQIRLHGPREVVRQLRPVPTDFGVQLQGGAKDQFQQGVSAGDSASAFLNPRAFEFEQMADAPVTMTVTVPEGVPIYLYDLSGKITIGDLRSEVVATLNDSTVLRGGSMSAANLTLNGKSKAYISDLTGGADVTVFGNGKLLLGGTLARLRAVVDHEGHVEVVGKVDWLQAAVSGRGYLNAKGDVDRADYDVRAGGFIRLAKVLTAVHGSRSGAGQVDVLEAPPKMAGIRRGLH